MARAAVESQASAYGVVDAIVFALGAAQLLQSPESAAEAVRLRAELADATGLRDHWHGEARTSYARITELESDRSVDVPQLREQITAWSQRCRTAESERDALRVDLAEAKARVDVAPSATWFLADYDGAEGGPTLHATVDAAKAWADERSAGDAAWDWFEQDGVWEQWTCDADTDRPTSRGSGTVTPLLVPGGERLREQVAEMVRVALGDRQVQLFDDVGEVRQLRAVADAQLARAETLDRLAREHRGRADAAEARVAELEAAGCRCFAADMHAPDCASSRLVVDGVEYSAAHWYRAKEGEFLAPIAHLDGSLELLVCGDSAYDPMSLAEAIAECGPLARTEFSSSMSIEQVRAAQDATRGGEPRG